MPLDTHDQVVARANSYSTLARAFSAPSAWDDELVTDLRRNFAWLGAELLEPAERSAAAVEASGADRQALEVAFAGLFLGPFEMAAPPYASLYLDPERRLMGAVSLSVAKAYAEAGLAPSNAPREAPDHVTHELEFMYYLKFQEATTGDSTWRERADRFRTRQLEPWLPEFARRLAAADRHPVYNSLADLLTRFVTA